MPTERLYYTDALATTFDARVTATVDLDGRPGAVLDRTAFYPTSGGQPHDTGRLGAARVVDVIDQDDGEIVHVLDAALTPGATVQGEIDWGRRFDHMQQHTGQHVLSAAFDRLHGAATTSFHLGAENATIDLAREVTPAEIAAAEREANRIVWDDVALAIRFVAAEEAARLPLRKDPARTGPLRLVEVPGFDLSACGGTHVPRTGVIGVIAVPGWERFKGGSRITFVCGGRALAWMHGARDVLSAATRDLSIGAAELPAAIERLRREAKEQARLVRQLQEEVAVRRAADFLAQAETIGDRRVVLRAVPGWDASALKALAMAIVAEAGSVAVLVGEAEAGRPVPVVAARAADVALDAGRWLQRAASELGGRGGGRPEMAQGGLAADATRILAFARETLGAPAGGPA